MKVTPAPELNKVLMSEKQKPLITIEQLRAICPYAPKSADVFIPYLNRFMRYYMIDTPARISAFIAQLAQESGSFRYVREIASGKAYEGRKDLGNVHPGDGVRHKGRGLIQVTGRANYESMSLKMFGDKRLLDNPDLLTVPEYAVQSACIFFTDRRLHLIADEPDVPTYIWNKKKRIPFEWITIKINGGLTHIAERKAFWERAKRVIV